MASINELIVEPEFKMLALIAGENGLYRQITGINVIESVDSIPFCRPNEIIITTGIHLDSSSTQLEELIMRAFEKKAAGFIINTGQYILNVPSSICKFANEKNFPIFEMAWNYRIADLLKSTFQFLSAKQHSAHNQQTDEKLLYNLIFRYEEFKFLIESLEKRGFPKGSELGVITCTTPTSSKNSIQRYESIIFYEFQNRYNYFLALRHYNQLIFLINRQEVKTAHIPFSKTVEMIYEDVIKINGQEDLIIGMGNFSTYPGDISKSYNESLTVIHLVEQHKNPFIQKYKEIGAYKLLMSVSDQSIIKAFQQDMLGPLYMYDHLHNTDFVHFLRIFLAEEGSTSKISKKLFIHRNTVNYKIKKIESLLDVNLSHTFTRTNLNLALMIEDILSQKNALK
ncbi:PucR family transcriptional regulator [Lysinibacillus sp. SGAir0095]|uniref:PucR family transcriptional regulator n=1 Tax=Lysinibacillus sp. SGAir0095 TaxID=2070463 RepID=UPI0010CCE84F|nr:PucR family transcriptional regulator [Lysinibacillus sp. SGAir0095]QCR30881.1 PucR family transcriptional regulator [Lysinibacillus sp. SGAir0095]